MAMPVTDSVSPYRALERQPTASLFLQGMFVPGLTAVAPVNGVASACPASLSLEPHVTAATWQVDRAIPEA